MHQAVKSKVAIKSLILCMFFIQYPLVFADVLVVATVQDNANDRESDLFIELAFEKEYPNIDLQFFARPTPTYKNMISEWISTEGDADIFYGFSGKQFNQFAEAGYLANLNNVWRKIVPQPQFNPTVLSAVSLDENVFAFPASNTSWGIYYNKAVFKKHKLNVPETWQEFLDVCQVLLKNDVIPLGLGSKDPWVLAAWFEYINIRLNGVNYYLDVINGRRSYDDQKMRSVFEYLKVLYANSYFLPSHADLSWFEVLPALFRGHAAMMLMGSFTNSLVPESVTDDIGFFPFPDIEPQFAHHEIAPTDILMVSSRSKNMQNVTFFLEFFNREITTKLGTVKNRRGLPIHINSDVSGSSLIKEGYQILQNSQKTTQFFDRQSPPELVQPTLEILAEFAKSQDIDKAIVSLKALMGSHQKVKIKSTELSKAELDI